jgi:hypothetical protein
LPPPELAEPAPPPPTLQFIDKSIHTLYIVGYMIDPTTSWVLTAILLPFLAGGVAGVCMGVLTKWGLIKFAVELEYRVDSLEDRISKEVKTRAQERSLEARRSNKSLLEWAQNGAEEPHTPSAFPDLQSWRKNKMVGK